MGNDSDPVFENDSIACKIEKIIQNLPKNSISLIELLNDFGKDGLILVAIVLALIFLVPVSIPGVSTVFGTGLLLLGLAGLFDCRPWLPGAIAHRRLPTELLRQGLTRALGAFRRLETISQPHRWAILATGYWVTRLNHVSFMVAALLLMAPFGFIPFTNTLPALALIFLGVGMLQRDGVFVVFGNVAIVLTIAYYTVLLSLGGLSIQGWFQLMM